MLMIALINLRDVGSKLPISISCTICEASSKPETQAFDVYDPKARPLRDKA